MTMVQRSSGAQLHLPQPRRSSGIMERRSGRRVLSVTPVVRGLQATLVSSYRVSRARSCVSPGFTQTSRLASR